MPRKRQLVLVRFVAGWDDADGREQRRVLPEAKRVLDRLRLLAQEC